VSESESTPVDIAKFVRYARQEGSGTGVRRQIGLSARSLVGAHAEFMVREYLRRGGLSKEQIKDVTLVVTPPVNAEQSLRLGLVDVAALSGVMRDRALGGGGIRPLFTDRGLFGHFNSSTMSSECHDAAHTRDARPRVLRIYTSSASSMRPSSSFAPTTRTSIASPIM
jgi:hypothetical protein